MTDDLIGCQRYGLTDCSETGTIGAQRVLNTMYSNGMVWYGMVNVT